MPLLVATAEAVDEPVEAGAARSHRSRVPIIAGVVVAHVVVVSAMLLQLNKPYAMKAPDPEVSGFQLALIGTASLTAPTPPAAVSPHSDGLSSFLPSRDVGQAISEFPTAARGAQLFRALDRLSDKSQGRTAQALAAAAGVAPTLHAPDADPWAHPSFLATSTPPVDARLTARLARCDRLSRTPRPLLILVSLDALGGVSEVRAQAGPPPSAAGGLSNVDLKHAVAACGPYPELAGAPRTLSATLAAPVG